VNPSSSGPAKGYELALTEASWRSHRLKSVDVAVVPINFNFLQGDSAAAHFFQSNDHALDVSGLKQTGTSEGDGVFVLGFPMGIVGKTRNSVFVRSGVLARIRDTLSVNTRPFIVDASVFPGNSGGPVVSKPEVITIQGTMASSKANLIGVVAGYLTYEEVAFSRQSNKPRVLFEENSGLSTVFSVDCIRQTIRQFERAQATQTPLTPKHSTRAETEDPAPASVT
jgi:S1-C subfamily serine protease